MAVRGTTFLDALAAALRAAARFDRNDQEAPLAVLWTDGERQWEPLIPRLRDRLPVLTLGGYDPATRSGPAPWVRALLARALPEAAALLPDGMTPIIYLPGVNRADLRAPATCPKELQPLVFLQYRGVFWSQRNGRDWTVPAFLQSADPGLGIEIGSDPATRDACLRALLALADVPVERLRAEAPLRAPFFNGLLIGDPARLMLAWIHDPAGFREGCSPEAWQAFRDAARQQYGCDPEQATPIEAARLLGERPTERWQAVWEQYTLTPEYFSNVPERLRQARPAQAALPLFARPDAWPQENEEREERLRKELTRLRGAHAKDARAAVLQLESEHRERREWVWVKLGQAPLACALEHLAALARATERVPAGPALAEIVRAYTEWGWRADGAALLALGSVERQIDRAAVEAAVLALYRPWLEETAREFQRAFASEMPAAGRTSQEISPGTCLLFADGLRFDLAQRLGTLLDQRGACTGIDWRFGALPGVTPTAKPAITPVADRLAGGPGFETVVRDAGTRVNAEVLRRLLAEAGWQVLTGMEHGDPSRRAWTELGKIDSAGHEYGIGLPRQVEGELREIAERIQALLDAGWQRVVVLTDHGWILLPEGLPKAELPEHLTEVRKSRCARLKTEARVTQQVVPWHWDHETRIAVAPGISCFEAGTVYAHGGLSPQECVVPLVTVTPRPAAAPAVSIQHVQWRGLRCSVQITPPMAGAEIDIRLKAGDPQSSIATRREADATGLASLLVEDSDFEGMAAHIVVLDRHETVIAQALTKVGG